MGVQLQATSFQTELNVRQIVRLYAGLPARHDDEAIARCDVVTTTSNRIGPGEEGREGVQAALRRTATATLAVRRGDPRTGAAAARRANVRPRPAITTPAVEPDRAHPGRRREHLVDHALDGRGPGHGLRPSQMRDHRPGNGAHARHPPANLIAKHKGRIRRSVISVAQWRGDARGRLHRSDRERDP